jgi:hypothetical protein
MSPDQVWTLEHEGHEHRVVAGRKARHVVRWYVDGGLHAERTTMDDKVTLTSQAADDEAKLLVYYSGLGAPRRATLYPDGDDGAALVRLGGVDLVPEPGSGAEAYDNKLREHPNRYAALAALGGAAKVLIPILLTLIAVRIAINIPWPNLPFPSIPRPDLPSIPWPDLPTPDLPDWRLPDWVRWLLDKAKYVWPVVVAYVIARAEIKRRRDRTPESGKSEDQEADRG